MLWREGTECGKDAAIDAASVEQECPADLLDKSLALLVEGGGVSSATVCCMLAP